MFNLTFSEYRDSSLMGEVRVVEPGSGLWSLPVSRCEIVSGDWGGRGCGQREKNVSAAQSCDKVVSFVSSVRSRAWRMYLHLLLI